jgi:catechol 2,3-dioxygenase-like lactoylglutathione lyase family enzyme
MLLAYTMIGTNDYAKAMTLYEPVMAILGAKKIDAYSTDTRTWFGRDGAGMIAIGGTANGEPATGGNGTMLGLSATSSAMIDAAYAKAMEMGATDEGAPGPRGPGMYFAYFRDFDGNKIAMFTMVAG